MTRRPEPANARLDLPLLALQHVEVGHLEHAGDDLGVRRFGLELVDIGAPLRPASQPLRVVEVQVREDHVLDLMRLDPQLLQRPDHRGALHDQAGIDEVVALAADEQRVREGDHAGSPAALLELLVAAEAVSGARDRRYLGVTGGDSEDEPLRGYENVDACQAVRATR